MYLHRRKVYIHEDILTVKDRNANSSGGTVMKSSVLCRHWKNACCVSWTSFFCFQIAIGFDRYFSKEPLCSYGNEVFNEWNLLACFAVLGGFAVEWSILLSRILKSSYLKDRAPFMIYFNIVSMGAITSFLSFTLNWGGLCIDNLGVATNASIWGEWLSCGPLLVFLLLTIAEKPKLLTIDWFLIALFFFSLFCGFLVILPQSRQMSQFWLVLACLTYAPFLFLPHFIEDTHKRRPFIAFNDVSQRYKRQRNICYWVTLTMPLFSVSYFLALFGVFDASMSVFSFQFLSMATKGLYAAVLMDVHFDTLVVTQQALSLEQTANEARRVYLKYLFHEVRTPLNSLSIGIDILDRNPQLGEEDRESLQMMRVAADFMSKTLNDVLSMQKIEEGKLELDMQPFYLVDVVSSVLLIFTGAASVKGLQLQQEMSPGIPERVLGDRFRVEHVLGNLLSNAIKFSPQGGRITIAASSSLQPSSASPIQHPGLEEDWALITVSVRDEGPGVALEHQHKLFGNFVQLHANQQQKGQGSGLGLSLCKQIVELHGGTIGMSSQPGQGSEFHFTIPFIILPPASSHSIPKPTNAMQPLLVATAVLEAPTVTTPCRNKTILVVDDVESNRKMMKMLLRREGIVTDVAENGQKAVDLVLNDLNKYCLLLMDNQMPVMNGVDATRILRMSGYRNLIVGVTGNVLEDDVHEYLTAGADLVMFKPLKLNQLSTILAFMDQNGPISKGPSRVLKLVSNKFVWVVMDTSEDLEWC
mmetsp:Transcript_9476/g.13093  ORF Transcript_9476/g.13093 Transcript_9476/m.13093 type:complete len:755 (+) Transcript_9476:48-2312(+)